MRTSSSRRFTACFLVLAGPVACGDSGTTSATEGGTQATQSGGPGSATETPTGTGTGSSGGASASASTGTPTTTEAVDDSTGSGGGGIKLDLGTQADFAAGCDCGMASEFSYIWVANSPEGTVSKIKTPQAANCGVYGRIQAVG